jgi:O-antigen/teichoic acid export membrane protein
MLLKYGLLQLAGRFVPGVIGFVVVALLTRILPPHEFGIFGVVTALIQLIALAGFAWLGLAVMRFATGRADTGRFMASVFAVFWTAVAVIVVAGALSALMPFATGHVGIIATAVFGGIVFALFDLRGAFYASACDFVSPMVLNIARALVGAVVAVAVAYYGGGGLAVSLASSIAALCIIVFFCRSLVKLSPVDANDIRRIYAFGLPVAGGLTLFAVSSWSDRLVLSAYSGAAVVGLYAAATAIVQNTLQLAANAIGSTALPLAVLAHENGGPESGDRQLGQNLVALLGLLLPAGVGLCLLAPNVAAVLVGKDYRPAVVELTPFLVGAAVLSGIRANCVDHCFQLAGTTWHLVAIALLMATVNLGALAVLVPLYAHIGAGIAALITAAAGLIYGVVAARRVYRTHVPFLEIGKVVGATVVMSAILIPMAHFRGIDGLVIQLVAGGITYLAVAFALNLLNLRGVATMALFRRGAPQQ